MGMQLARKPARQRLAADQHGKVVELGPRLGAIGQ
jgi:hypothetical protein